MCLKAEERRYGTSDWRHSARFRSGDDRGAIRFHEWLGDSWAVLFSHPKDFTPVCTTELGYMARIKPEFDKRNVKIIGLSVDPVDNHGRWADDIRETQGHAPNYPMIGDTDLSISKLYGMLPASAAATPRRRTPADNQTVRNVFVIGPDKKIKLVLVYPMTTGRNFDEVLRVIDSLQLTAKHRVATPVNWKQGEDVIIAGSVTDEEAKKIYPDGWKAPRPYIRIVPHPSTTCTGPRSVFWLTHPRPDGPERRAGFSGSACRCLPVLAAGRRNVHLERVKISFGIGRSRSRSLAQCHEFVFGLRFR